MFASRQDGLRISKLVVCVCLALVVYTGPGSTLPHRALSGLPEDATESVLAQRDLAGNVRWYQTLRQPGARELPVGRKRLRVVKRKEQPIRTDDLTNEWAVKVEGGELVAREVARDLGLEYGGKIGSLDGYYHLRHPSASGARQKRAASEYKSAFDDDSRVSWAERQAVKIRSKRDYISKREEELAYRNIRHSDQFWSKEWYLKDNRDSLDYPKLDLHVLPVWNRNITGRGVVVSVLDDGIEHTHTDLQANYDPEASYDLNSNDHDPMPRYDSENFNKHGTRCAGEIAMVADNGKCGVGVAYNAKIGGIRMLDGVVTDRLEGAALSYNIEHVDIMSASWGPEDDGGTVEGPGTLATEAFINGITKGRDGKGVIYVWASGNGGGKYDDCDCDGYTGSIYTVSISSASQGCKSPWYAEQCASTMATTYSSGTFEEQKIISTDLHDTCTQEHTGTSASAPLAAGIFALLLEFNPTLTWRDVQHLVAWTSEYAPLKKNSGWTKNGAGYWVNPKFGFGLLNAAELINSAEPAVFKSVPEKRVCMVMSEEQSGLPRELHSGHEVVINITTSGCRDQDNEVRHLEHIQLMLDMSYSRRGDLELYLVSPSGTNTTLLSPRPSDSSEDGFLKWPFMSVHNWGEDPEGVWVLTIRDKELEGGNNGNINNISLVMHGTQELPDHVKRAGGRRTYNYYYNNVQDTRDNSKNEKLPSSEHSSEETDEDLANYKKGVPYSQKTLEGVKKSLGTNIMENIKNINPDDVDIGFEKDELEQLNLDLSQPFNTLQELREYPTVENGVNQRQLQDLELNPAYFGIGVQRRRMNDFVDEPAMISGDNRKRYIVPEGSMNQQFGPSSFLDTVEQYLQALERGNRDIEGKR